MTTNHHCQAGGKKHSTKKKSRHVKNKTKSKKKTFRKTRKSMKGGTQQRRRRRGRGRADEELFLLAALVSNPVGWGVAAAGLGAGITYGGFKLGRAAYSAARRKWKGRRLDYKVKALKEAQKKIKSLPPKYVKAAFHKWAETAPSEQHAKEVETLILNLLNIETNNNNTNKPNNQNSEQHEQKKNKPLHE